MGHHVGMTTRSRARACSVAVVTAAAALALSACSSGGDSDPTPSATPVGTAVAQTCAELLPTEALSVYGTTFALDDNGRGLHSTVHVPGSPLSGPLRWVSPTAL